jgi:hypothetical protein
MGLMEEGH